MAEAAPADGLTDSDWSDDEEDLLAHPYKTEAELESERKRRAEAQLKRKAEASASFEEGFREYQKMKRESIQQEGPQAQNSTQAATRSRIPRFASTKLWCHWR